MSETQNVGATTKKTAKAAVVSDSKFIVKTAGYQETFGNQEDAKKQYDFLKKRTVKNEESIKIELIETGSHGKKTILESVSIGEDFYK